MSTHCWVTQQWMQPASKRQQVKQAWWRHTAVVGECHVLTWLLRDMLRWRHTAPGVGEYHMTSTFPQVTSHTLPLWPLPSNSPSSNGYTRHIAPYLRLFRRSSAIADLPVYLIVIKRECVTKLLINPVIRNKTRYFVTCTPLHVTVYFT
jgi:hypothetical protein